MLMPKRVKRRKQHRGHRRGKALRGNKVSFGEFGLQALESCWMTANQIESARRAMTRSIRRQGKIWIRIFPDKPFTKKPAETRMGSGKGAPEGWVCVIKPGRMLFEMAGVSEEVAKEAMRLAAHKLPINTKFVKREANVAIASDNSDDDDDYDDGETEEIIEVIDAADLADETDDIEMEDTEESAAEAPAAETEEANG